MLSSFTIALLCGMAYAVDAVDHIDTEVTFKNIYYMSGATLLPGYGGGEILKAGGQIAWEIKKGDGEDAKEELYMYQTIGVNIDQNYGKNASDDEETDEDEEDPIESPDKARIQVGLCAPDTGKALQDDDFMMCSLVEFQKDTKKILVKNWQQNQSTDYPDVTNMRESLTKPLWTDFEGTANNVVNADWIFAVDKDTVIKAPSDDGELNYNFGILTKNVEDDWDNKLEVTFYQVIKEDDADPSKADFIKKVKEEGLTWNGRQYLSAFDQKDLDDAKDNYAKMSISTVKYGVAKEGVTKGDDSWVQDTKVCPEEKNGAGYLAASLASFAVALAVMNF